MYVVPKGCKLGNEMVQMDGPPADQRDIIASPYFPYGSCPFVFNCVELIHGEEWDYPTKSRVLLPTSVHPLPSTCLTQRDLLFVRRF